jgi:uncharacterized protein (DUF58 family)
MLTARGWWFLVFVLALLLLTLWTNTPAIVLVCLTLLVWFFAAWLVFAVRLRLLHGKLRVEREVHDPRGPVSSLWAGRSFVVRARLCCDSALPSPYLHAADRVPFPVQRIAGEVGRDGSVARGRPLELEYHIFCAAPGRVRFEGLEVQLADPQGLFHHALFVPGVEQYRVLPALADARGHIPTVKRHNLLPLLGLHRHRRPGTGSELLDLRDYLPGDPPKMIAWKASARRDRLMTKEFESEVPVRCTLFVDTSGSVRVGPQGQNALARLVEISAAVAQAAAGARDLPGLCLFDEAQVTYLRPARGQRHLVNILNQLADAAALPATTAEAPAEPLLPLAYALAEELYPDLLRPEVNAVPFWLPWFWPLPAHSRRRPTRGGRVYLAVFLLLALVPAGLFGLFIYVLLSLAFQLYSWFHVALGVAVVGALGVSALTIGYARFEFVYRFLPQFFSSRRRRDARWRKRLAALLSARHGLSPGGLGALMEQDEAFSLAVQRFLAEHQVPYDLPLYDGRGRYLFAAPEKVGVLAGALLRAVGKGHDNELFVLLADLLELDDRLTPLLGAVKVAAARHHQVLVVCPWPPGVPLPRKAGAGRARGEALTARAAPLRAALNRAAVLRFHRAYYRVRRTFARLGVPVLCAREEDSVRLILDRLERLRTQERGVR